MLISYAQNFEDVILWRALKVNGPRTYIDVGAYDPRIDSVTRGLYELGFRGVHIEPLPVHVAALRADRPDELVIEAVVGTALGHVKFYSINDTGVSTLHPQLIRDVAGDVPVSPIEVESLTLEKILNAFSGPVGFLKIDVEGAEEDVITSWGESAVRPWIVVVEATLPLTTTPSYRAWEKMLYSRAYRFAYFDGVNRFYVHRSQEQLLRHFGPGPNVFDNFKLAVSTPYVSRLLRRMDTEPRGDVAGEGV